MKNCKSWLVGFWVVLVMMGGAGKVDAYPLVNGGFTDSSGWIVTDGPIESVTFVNGSAELTGDYNPYYTRLYQGVSVVKGSQYTLSFDYLTGISPVTGGAFSDLFSASIYFNSSDLLTNSSYSTLFDINADNLSIINGSIGAAVTAGFTGYTYTFTALDTWLFPTFDFSDLDGYTGGFTKIANVRLDEVNTAPVPEPSTILLLAGGGIFLIAAKVRRRS